jgi:predicted DNA-binding transcriptional regulator AlpA
MDTEYYTKSKALLTEAQAADFLNISIRSLQSWRVRGGGPAFLKLGRSVRYRYAELQTWLDANIATSTSSQVAK